MRHAASERSRHRRAVGAPRRRSGARIDVFSRRRAEAIPATGAICLESRRCGGPGAEPGRGVRVLVGIRRVAAARDEEEGRQVSKLNTKNIEKRLKNKQDKIKSNNPLPPEITQLIEEAPIVERSLLDKPEKPEEANSESLLAQQGV